MKHFLILTLLLSALNSQASSTPLLLLKREKPFVDCEILHDSVKITRSSQGVKFTKRVSYQMDDFSQLIQNAYDGQVSPSGFKSEYFASVKGVGFYLDANESNALKLINLISTLCEVRNI